MVKFFVSTAISTTPWFKITTGVCCTSVYRSLYCG